jgi:hypothetical protein
VLYFNPRELRLTDLDGDAFEHSDLVCVDDRRVGVYRSLAVVEDRFPTRKGMDIFRFDFARDPEHGVRPAGRRLITRDSGHETMPAVCPGGDRIVFLYAYPGRNRRVVFADIDGDEPHIVDAPQDMDFAHPRFLADGRLLVAVRRDGVWRVNTMDTADHGLSIFADEIAPQGGLQDLVLGSVCESRRVRPVLFRVPRELDLVQVSSFVKAYNAQVNRRRAL